MRAIHKKLMLHGSQRWSHVDALNVGKLVFGALLVLLAVALQER
ncbi:hypothetical protein CHELA1G11_11667 [Hyphomicrobiales bacterium]|nr:hypothetical protein CHELA1G11_11667 [Hyphomicrobiales bacterium]CAH1666152.1 hypothetical protein CHELA1G2_12641 [Hyphomicrobiales bacterium]